MKNIQKIFLLFCLLATAQSKANTISDQPKPPKTTAANLLIFMAIPSIPGSLDITVNRGNLSNIMINDAIEINAYSFEEENSISIGSITGGGGAGKAVAPTFEFSVYLENAVVDFYKNMMKGQVIPEVKIYTAALYNGMDHRLIEEINIKNVYVSFINATATADISAPVIHSVKFQFGSIKKMGYSYSPTNTATMSESIWSYLMNTNSY